MKKQLIVISVFSLILLASQVNAESLGFENITNNNSEDAAIGEAQLTVDLSEYDGQAIFTFINSGPAASSITGIYFDDDVPLLTFDDFYYDTEGVAFSEDTAPANVPGGNGGKENPYSFYADYSYDSDSPVQPNGINPGEALTLIFDFKNSNFSDVMGSILDKSFRIGIHVQGFASGGSESFINTPSDFNVPEPTTMLLFGSGIAALTALRRRKQTRFLV